MEYSKEDLMEAKRQILGVGENMGTEESKKIWEKNAQFWDDAMGDESNEFHREVVRPKVTVPFPVSWTVKMKKKQKETQDILSYHSQAAGCSDKARAKASGGRQPIEECGRTGL